MAAWWDAVELWLTGLPFLAQLPLVLVVLVPVCLGAAVLLDRAADLVAGRLRWRRGPAPDAAAGAARDEAPPRGD